MKFTDFFIQSLKPEEKKYYKREANGFTIRVMPSGVMTWLYVYTFDGKRKEMNLGKLPGVTLKEARKRYNAAYNRHQEGFDPGATDRLAKEERRKAPTVSDLVSDYIDRHAKRFKRSWAKDERILNREVVTAWGNRKAADIVKRDVILLLEKIVDRDAPAMANNTFQIIRKMFNWAVEQDILPHTPCTGVKLPSPKLSRDRVLSEAEIKTLWSSLDRTDLCMSDDARRALKLILVTAQRPGEVIGMHSGEIDGQWWTIPAERAKNGKTHRVYLTATALALIGPLKVLDDKTGEMKTKGYIFPSPVKKSKKQPGKEIIKPFGDTALAIAVGRNLAYPLADAKGKPLYTKDGKPATENRLSIDHFTPHDLRRTAATFMAKSGEMDEVIDAVLNHAKQGVIKVYNQYRYDKEKQAALETWERKLNSIITGTESNVIALRRKVA
ncbi:site-specific integrase [Oryzomonas sagensis]|uniref:Site-specific integrase n=1 Tax=Oryzomonas sagensis TaxID=2603857 RepID=A0ABQ6TN88_9BACT|nr:site-specific integrase [Oryzomonas sagensis]KAB0670084.1 site-specific integrase [Oryzomonas sagensis]